MKILRCHGEYTKKVRHQNQHGRDWQGQSEISLSVFGPRVALFFAHAPVCALTVSTFFIFENFENFNVLTVSAQTGALAHFGDKSCIFELTVSAQTGALAHFWRQILHFRAHRKCTNWSTFAFWRQILHFRAHRKCTDWSTCILSATNPARSSSP